MSTTVRLPLRLEQTLSAYCAETRRSKSEVIIEALERRFSEVQLEKSAYAAAVEAGFIGAFASADASPQGEGTKSRVKSAIRRKHRRDE
jgi:predicted transcriptional regulator